MHCACSYFIFESFEFPFQLSTSGYISIGRSKLDLAHNKTILHGTRIIASYKPHVSGKYGAIYYRETFNATELRLIKNRISKAGIQDLKPNHALIVTFDHVKQKYNPFLENVIQIILASNGTDLVSIIHYHVLDDPNDIIAGYFDERCCRALDENECQMKPFDFKDKAIVIKHIVPSCNFNDLSSGKMIYIF